MKVRSAGLTVEYKVRGKSLFLRFAAEEGDSYLNASAGGQLAWPPALDHFIDTVDYDEDQRTAFRWWPRGREEPVIIDTFLNGGLPSTALSGVRTHAIAVHRREGFKVASIADDVGATNEEVLAALRFERIAA
jgi:hypothetical protein